ncbi:hypothetical protein CDL15_Pgr000186 [Punica granatum]|uniref:Uncharacterized protein n=1 Tax=Punica granatum TaxID=22663 RepID=A0A218Y3X3_PUNGR|nr:hypothetical protein CDL15_Pgr000186 [Punica granatum]
MEEEMKAMVTVVEGDGRVEVMVGMPRVRGGGDGDGDNGLVEEAVMEWSQGDGRRMMVMAMVKRGSGRNM